MNDLEVFAAELVRDLETVVIYTVDQDEIEEIVNEGRRENYPACCIDFYVRVWTRSVLESKPRYAYYSAFCRTSLGRVPCPQCLAKALATAGLSAPHLRARIQREVERAWK
jgi:hypothetical protein